MDNLKTLLKGRNNDFNQKVKKFEFDEHVIKLDCSTDWVEEKVIATANLIRSDEFPKPSNTCENCNYLKKRWELSQKINSE